MANPPEAQPSDRIAALLLGVLCAGAGVFAFVAAGDRGSVPLSFAGAALLFLGGAYGWTIFRSRPRAVPLPEPERLTAEPSRPAPEPRRENRGNESGDTPRRRDRGRGRDRGRRSDRRGGPRDNDRRGR